MLENLEKWRFRRRGGQIRHALEAKQTEIPWRFGAPVK